MTAFEFGRIGARAWMYSDKRNGSVVGGKTKSDNDSPGHDRCRASAPRYSRMALRHQAYHIDGTAQLQSDARVATAGCLVTANDSFP